MAKKHNDKIFNAILKEQFKGGFEKQFRNGLAQGTYAACKVVYDMASNEKKTIEERIENIKRFSSTFLRNESSDAPAEEAIEVKEDAGTDTES